MDKNIGNESVYFIYQLSGAATVTSLQVAGATTVHRGPPVSQFFEGMWNWCPTSARKLCCVFRSYPEAYSSPAHDIWDIGFCMVWFYGYVTMRVTVTSVHSLIVSLQMYERTIKRTIISMVQSEKAGGMPLNWMNPIRLLGFGWTPDSESLATPLHRWYNPHQFWGTHVLPIT